MEWNIKMNKEWNIIESSGVELTTTILFGMWIEWNKL